MVTIGQELILRILFLLSLVILFSVRLYYHKKSGTFAEKTVAKDEGLLLGLLRIFFVIPFLLTMILFIVSPDLLYFFSLQFDFPVRIFGIILIYLGVIFILWTNISLDRNFSTTLIVRDDHKLITNGLYKYIRHPMYTGISIWLFGMLLATDNWFLLLIIPIYTILIMGFRMVKEEAMLESKFGDEYQNYKKRTKRFIPRLF